MQRLRSWFRHQLVDQPDVGEGSPGHDGVVAAARTVGVELARNNSQTHQEPESRHFK